jgi:hypothetical protein
MGLCHGVVGSCTSTRWRLGLRKRVKGMMTGINSSLSELDFKFEVINADLKHLPKMLYAPSATQDQLYPQHC